jgi:hypothetical protein
VCNGLEAFGFEIEEDLTGLIRSDDEPHSLFWMFLITAQKRGSINNTSKRCFIDDSFGFSQLKTPENREVKGARVRESARRKRKVRHRSFELLLLRDMEQIAHSVQLIYPHVVAL